MKRFLLSVFISSLFAVQAIADSSCFLAKENGKILIEKGQCSERRNPGCEFSIILSLMGFDSGILKDETNPVWPYKKGYETFLNFWKQPHNPRTWILDSCVWYSANIMEEVGIKKFGDYIRKFSYGNQDISNVTRDDWTGSLLISPHEQAEFLQKFIDRKLFVSDKAYEMTEKIIFVQDLPGGWKLYGKTGVGEGKGEERTGWFIGWIAKGDRKIAFVSNMVDLKKHSTISSFRARNEALVKLFWLINDLEK